MSVLFSSVLLLRKSPNFVRDPVSPASLSLGASASSKACKRPHHLFKTWRDVKEVCSSLQFQVEDLNSVGEFFLGHHMVAALWSSQNKHGESDALGTHIKELLALDLPHKLHHKRLCECAVHQRQCIVLISACQYPPPLSTPHHAERGPEPLQHAASKIDSGEFTQCPAGPSTSGI